MLRVIGLRASKSPRVPEEQISYQLGHRRPGDHTTPRYGVWAGLLGTKPPPRWMINRVLKLAETNSHSIPTTATKRKRRCS
jgi:hypothetical protein